MDFSIRLLNSVRNLPDGQVKFFRGLQITDKKLLSYYAMPVAILFPNDRL